MGPEDIECFLQSYSGDGQIDSGGKFTLSPSEAIKKLAHFQLPFECAWAVKLVQAIVATGSQEPIEIEIGTASVNFNFLNPDFGLDEVEVSFFDLEMPATRSLRHLMSALWVVGIRNRWKFQISLLGEESSLDWNGKGMERVKAQPARVSSSISISSGQERFLYMIDTGMNTSRDSDLVLALKRNCCVCPVPLSIGGRRIDALQNLSTQGWKATSFPVLVGALQIELPAFNLAPGTFDKAIVFGKVMASQLFIESPFDDNSGGWRRVTLAKMANLVSIPRAPLAYVVSAHRPPPVPKLSGAKPIPSTAYWVLDGAIVGQSPLLAYSTHCSIDCFLSAEGLETDISTLNVTSSDESNRRLNLARLALGHEPLELGSTTLTGKKEKFFRLSRRALGGTLALASIFLTSLSLPAAFALGCAGAGVGFYNPALKAREKKLFITSLKALQESLLANAKEQQE